MGVGRKDDVDPNGRVVFVPVGAGAMAGLTRLLLIGAEAATAGKTDYHTLGACYEVLNVLPA